jgi:hypothetical protein
MTYRSCRTTPFTVRNAGNALDYEDFMLERMTEQSASPAKLHEKLSVSTTVNGVVL